MIEDESHPADPYPVLLPHPPLHGSPHHFTVDQVHSLGLIRRDLLLPLQARLFLTELR